MKCNAMFNKLASSYIHISYLGHKDLVLQLFIINSSIYNFVIFDTFMPRIIRLVCLMYCLMLRNLEVNIKSFASFTISWEEFYITMCNISRVVWPISMGLLVILLLLFFLGGIWQICVYIVNEYIFFVNHISHLRIPTTLVPFYELMFTNIKQTKNGITVRKVKIMV